MISIFDSLTKIMAGCSEAALADPAEVSDEIDPAVACIAAGWGGGGEGEWLWPRSRCGGTTLAPGGMVSRCRRAAS